MSFVNLLASPRTLRGVSHPLSGSHSASPVTLTSQILSWTMLRAPTFSAPPPGGVSGQEPHRCIQTLAPSLLLCGLWPVPWPRASRSAAHTLGLVHTLFVDTTREAGKPRAIRCVRFLLAIRQATVTVSVAEASLLTD